MSTKNTKGVKSVAIILLVLGGIGYFIYRKSTKKTKAQKVAAILSNPKGAPGSNYQSLISFDDGYIDAWYTALKKGDTAFVFNNKTYATRGGKILAV